MECDNISTRNIVIIAIIAIVIIVAGLYASGMLTGGTAEGNITVVAGAGTMSTMNDLKAEFEKKYPGTTVNIQYGNSAEIFSILESQKSADLVVPGDLAFMDNAKNKGYLVNDTITPLVYHIPVIGVQKGNPKNITNISDLGQAGLKVGLGDVNGTAVGKQAVKLLNKTGNLEAVRANVVVYAPTVNQLLTYLTSGQVDAAIVMNDSAQKAAQEGKIDIIAIPEDQNEIGTIGVALTVFSENENTAQKFLEFISSPEGMAIWEKHGFPPVK